MGALRSRRMPSPPDARGSVPESRPPLAQADEERFCRETVGVIDERGRGVLGLRGKRATEFLQRLLSSDVKALDPGRGQPSSLLTGKGKLVAAFDLYLRPSTGEGQARYMLLFGEALRAEVERAFEKYGVLDDIEVEDLT